MDIEIDEDTIFEIMCKAKKAVNDTEEAKVFLSQVGILIIAAICDLALKRKTYYEEAIESAIDSLSGGGVGVSSAGNEALDTLRKCIMKAP